MRNGKYTAGVVTPYGLFNFGNRLQALAVQELLKQFNVLAEEVVFPGVNKQTGFKQSIKPILFGKFNRSKQATRYRSFRAFDNMIAKRFYKDESSIADSGYDFAIVGSDQIWNPNSIHPSPAVFGEFVRPDRRICLSPSFGVEKMDSTFAAAYVTGIQRMAHLSVREDAGKKIIHQLTGRNAEVLIDPTLALSSEEWSIRGRYKYVPSKKYIFSYFLSKDAIQYKTEIKGISHARDLEIVDIMDRESTYYGAGPQDFISLIENSSLVCTDSFHATVFSLIFQRPFVVYSRLGASPMNSRIHTLSSMFGLPLSSKKLELLNISDELLDDISSKKVIENQRKRLMAYLKSCTCSRP